MEELLIIIFFILVGYLIMDKINTKEIKIINDKPTHSKPKHVLNTVLNDFSRGDKISLTGECNIRLYTRNTITVDMKSKFKNLINKIFMSVYGLTDHIYELQELNNIYEKTDTLGNKRYILDATIISKNNYYTVNVVVDFVVLNGEILVNSVNTNYASNNNIMNRFDVVFNEQGILLDRDNFKENVGALLDNKYREQHKVIAVDASKMDIKNYELDNVLSLTSLLNRYYPATTSKGAIKNLESKGMSGLTEKYFPPDLQTIESQQYCPGGSCVFRHNSSLSEYTQPYMAPGLFYDRSSYPIN
jgi:hypothetical protein